MLILKQDQSGLCLPLVLTVWNYTLLIKMEIFSFSIIK